MVLVHGLAGSTRWWGATIPTLSRSYRLYLVDLPGFGSMRRAPGGFVLREASAWLLAWMRAAGLERAHLVGHSMGGYICLRLAAHSPQSVERLVLVDPAGVPSGRAAVGHLWPLVMESVLASPDLLPIMVGDALRAGPQTVWRAAMDLLAQDAREELHHVQTPTLLVWGERDALVPLTLGYVLRREITCSRLLVIKGARHTPMIDSPREFNRALLDFFAGRPVGK